MKGFRFLLNFIRVFVGVGTLSCGFVLPLIGAALFFPPRIAMGIVIFLFVVPFTFLLLLSEWGTLRLVRGQVPRTLGLRNSYELAKASAGVTLKVRPALLTFPDPIPNIFVVRALGGDGAILVSDGLIALLSENELRLVLRRAIRHLASGEAVLQGASLLVLSLLREKSHMDESAEGVSVLAAFKKFIFHPWFLFFEKAARKMVTRRVGQDIGGIGGDSKLARASRLYGRRAELPGLVYLGIEG